MSSTMADALTFYDQDETTETRVFIRMIDQFFDCMNVRSKLEGKLRRKDQRFPYTSSNDHRFKVITIILSYLTHLTTLLWTHILVAQGHILAVS